MALFVDFLEENKMTEITIISGFLGAGKTTLIKKLLEEVFKGEKIVLIENEIPLAVMQTTSPASSFIFVSFPSETSLRI